MKKEILITSFYFYPENTPRAFRTFELAKEFAREGHSVKLFIPNYDYDYSALKEEYGFEIVKVKTGLFGRGAKNLSPKTTSRSNKKKSFVKKIADYISGGIKLDYAFLLFKRLLKEKSQYDMLISVGLPMTIHFGSSLAIMFKRKLAKLKVADCGDPYYFNPENNFGVHHKFIEKFIMKRFHYITIPTKKAVDLYKYFKKEDKIKIIPQGFDFREVKRADYKKNKVTSFAYAGLFYKKIRNPEKFLEYLCKLDQDFRFIIYTNLSHKESHECIDQYVERLGKKLVLNNSIPRLDCIHELSKADFLINVENKGGVQTPSKLIDYSLSGRKIFSFNPDSFDEQKFMKFFDGNYEESPSINLDDFDIKNVAKAFLELG